MSKPIVLLHHQWERLKNRLTNDYSPSVMMIRDKRKKVLGFVEREHLWYDHQKGYMSHICLDFYDEPKRTMFLLKYSEYLDGRKNAD